MSNHEWCRAIRKVEVAGRNSLRVKRYSRRWRHWRREFYLWAAKAMRFAVRMGEPQLTISRNGIYQYEKWFRILPPL